MIELIDKTFDLLERVARNPQCSLRELSNDCGVPLSTAHRIVTTLVSRGYLVSERKGCYCLGPAWRSVDQSCILPSLLAAVSRRPLMNLARTARAHTHLGVIEEGMVTYIVKERYGRGEVHSVENTQLEAYCTAIGKCLLAQLPSEHLELYLENGPFVPLTPATITDPAEIRAQLSQVRVQGWASEVEENLPGLMCLSVPIAAPEIGAWAAISISIVHPRPARQDLLDRLPLLQAARSEIEARIVSGRKRARQIQQPL